MLRSAVGLGVLVWLAWGSVAFAIEGTVRLKNGGFIHGDVLEHLPGERVSVRTSDGAVRNIPWEEVERVEEGSAAAPAPEPPAAAQPAAPAAVEPAPTYGHAPPPAAQSWSEPQASPDEDRFNDVTLTLFGLLGVLGNAAVDGEVTVTQGGLPETSSESTDLDLELSYAAGLQLDVPVHRYFSIAPQVRLTSWWPKESEVDDKALFIDFLVAPRLRFPFVLSPGAIGVPYVQVPLGISYVDLPTEDVDDLALSPALTAGVSAGFLALLSKHVGFSLELGWLLRSFSLEYEIDVGDLPSGPITVESESDWSVTQVTIQLGLVIAF